MADGSDMVKVESLVQEFLSAQSLKVLPQGPFSDAVNQFVAKDDKHAMELFVSEHLTGQVRQMLGLESDDEDLNSAMEIYRTRIEQQTATSAVRLPGERKRVLRPRPDTWDSDFDGNWEDEPDAWTYEGVTQDMSLTTTQAQGRSSRGRTQDDEMLDLDKEAPAPKTTKRGTTRATKATTAKAPAKKAPAKKAPARGRGRQAVASEEEDEEDVVMESDEEPPPPPKPAPKTQRGQSSRAAAAPKKPAATRGAAKTRQTTLSFSQQGGTQDQALEVSDDEVSDEDAFEPPPVASRRRRR